MPKNVEDLEVFKLAHSSCLEIYALTKDFPPEERYGLITQMRRSAYSIPMNLIEGGYRLGKKEYRQFVGLARGSAGEVMYQLRLSVDLGYTAEEKGNFLIREYERIAKMLIKLAIALGTT